MVRISKSIIARPGPPGTGGGGSSTTVVQTTAPSSPAQGALWYDTDEPASSGFTDANINALQTTRAVIAPEWSAT